MKVSEVVAAARRAKEAGSTRFCMGAAWRELGGKKNAFRHILEMVREVGREGGREGGWEGGWEGCVASERN
jgi:biotin synthase